MIDYQYIFAMIKNFSVKYSCTPRSWQQVACIVGGQSCLRCGLWMDGIEKQITWKKTWKTWRKETQKNLERSWQQVVCIVWGSKFSQVWILGYVWYTSYLLTWMLHNAGKWMASKKQIETRKMTQKNSKVPKHVTLLIFLLLLCCSLYLPLSTYFVWRVADAVKEA